MVDEEPLKPQETRAVHQRERHDVPANFSRFNFTSSSHNAHPHFPYDAEQCETGVFQEVVFGRKNSQRNKYVLLRGASSRSRFGRIPRKARAISVFPARAPFIKYVMCSCGVISSAPSHVLAHEQKKNQQMALLYPTVSENISGSTGRIVSPEGFSKNR